MNNKVYRNFGIQYGPEEYLRDQEEWNKFCQSNDNGYKEYFKNDAYCARDRMQAYERGENPLHANANYRNNIEWLQAYASGCGCLVVVIIVFMILFSSFF